jgi:hypothetical protein
LRLRGSKLSIGYGVMVARQNGVMTVHMRTVKWDAGLGSIPFSQQKTSISNRVSNSE